MKLKVIASLKIAKFKNQLSRFKSRNVNESVRNSNGDTPLKLNTDIPQDIINSIQKIIE